MGVKVRPTGASYNRPASPTCPLKKSGPRAHRLCDDSIHIQVSKMQTNLQGEKADRSFDVLAIDILNFLSDSSNTCVISESSLLISLSLEIVLYFFLLPCMPYILCSRDQGK